MLVNAFVWVINTAIKSLGDIIGLILSLLPDSPFQSLSMPSSVSTRLGYLNWLVPVSSILTVLTAWLTAVSIFYIYQIILRWTKVIE